MPVSLLCPVLPSASFSWHAQTGSAGRCLCDAAVTTPSRFSGVDRPPWHREVAARNPAPTYESAEGTCRGGVVMSPRRHDQHAAASYNAAAVSYNVATPLSYPPALQAALWHTRL